ncbi:hypothetical protein SLNWT_7025 [Streptomyces albus]|uniref:Uncharacterized protein n=1 Tax=Streptomyces albus (strain ATCC 21838 / DSM 41398 / FERM P-419 / JCM 4703 / NBRC 107858) TaxID=1081613 RepID=A0A0B5F991_STRA4|nr:hypothetical protein SLNWT_7025 [Streptomyces albus]AOU81704.1 hypothetical protein SLNHY_7013 [Streptomyces albus]AYN37394.1 hypothetical protein DUI70_6901 [Streptomyces albus]
MTTPPADSLLFDVTAPATPVERLLLLAEQYVRHNDTLDCHLSVGPPSGADAHADSAQRLASATRTAVKAITDEELYRSSTLVDTIARLTQLAFLSAASADHPPAAARELTALAPEAAVECAAHLAAEIRRRHRSPHDASGQHLTTAQYTALAEIARGHLVTASSLGRQYVHYRDHRVPISTVRSLEAKDLAERTPNSAAPASAYGPLQDRVRLTAAGVTAFAAALSLPEHPGPTPSPLPAASPRPHRGR